MEKVYSEIKKRTKEKYIKQKENEEILQSDNEEEEEEQHYSAHPDAFKPTPLTNVQAYHQLIQHQSLNQEDDDDDPSEPYRFTGPEYD